MNVFTRFQRTRGGGASTNNIFRQKKKNRIVEPQPTSGFSPYVKSNFAAAAATTDASRQ